MEPAAGRARLPSISSPSLASGEAPQSLDSPGSRQVTAFAPRASLTGKAADAVSQFSQLFAKQAFQRGVEGLLEQRRRSSQTVLSPAVAAGAAPREMPMRIMYMSRDGRWRQRRERRPVSPARQLYLPGRRPATCGLLPRRTSASDEVISSPLTTRGRAPCLGSVAKCLPSLTDAIPEKDGERLTALSANIPAPLQRRVLAELPPRARTALARARVASEARAAERSIDEFVSRHADLLRGRGPQCTALRGTTAAAMSLKFKSRTMQFGRIRGTTYAALWRSMGSAGTTELYDAHVGGGKYSITLSSFEQMHTHFEKTLPDVWQKVLAEDPCVVHNFFRLVDANGDSRVQFSEFAAAIALITVSTKAHRVMQLVFDALDSVPPTGRLSVHHFDVDNLYDVILPRVPEEEDATWRRLLLAVHTIAQTHLKPQETWSYSQYIEHLFLHYRRPLEDEFGHLNISKQPQRETKAH